MAAFVRRWRWPMIIAALLLAGLAFAFRPMAEAVDVGEVTRGPMTVGVTDDGVTRAQEYYVVSAPVTGYLSRIELEPGDTVQRGTLITRMSARPSTPLDTRTRQELANALESARSASEGIVASLDQARKDLARAEELAERGFLARAQLEATQTRVSMAEASLAQSRAEEARLRAQLRQFGGDPSRPVVEVRSPASGAVLSVINESEGVIAEGTPLMTVGDPREIEAVIDLLSREAVQVEPGQRVEFTQWGGPEPLVGRVERIEPFGRLKVSALGIEEQRVNVIVGFPGPSAEQAARLGHGYQVDATIILWSDPRALRVPIGALFRGAEGDWRVFVMENGRAAERAVAVGHLNDEHAEVLSGLEDGEEVVLNPANYLEDGARVEGR